MSRQKNKDDYVHRPTDSSLYFLHKQGVWTQELEDLSHDKAALGDLLQLIKLFYWYELARLRESAAKSIKDKHKEAILAKYPSGKLPGLIGPYAKRWLRCLVVVKRAPLEVKDPSKFILDAGEQLHRLVNTVHVSLTTDEFILLQTLYARMYHEKRPLQVDSLELHEDEVIRLLKRGELQTGDNVRFGKAPEPTLKVNFVTNPQST